VRQNWASGFDASGRPIRIAGSSPSAHGTLIYPHKYGGTSWWSPAFSPSSGTFYVPSFDGPMLFFRSGRPEPVTGEQYLGGSYQSVAGEPPVARVKALSPISGEVLWEYRPRTNESRPIMGLLSTAGDLVFASHGSSLIALDAASGALLWQFDTGQPIKAAPMSFVVGGRQHVGVAAGSLLLAFSLPDD
jgi:alcohol dehydrogenase (cytochrome c)